MGSAIKETPKPQEEEEIFEEIISSNKKKEHLPKGDDDESVIVEPGYVDEGDFEAEEEETEQNEEETKAAEEEKEKKNSQHQPKTIFDLMESMMREFEPATPKKSTQPQKEDADQASETSSQGPKPV